VARLKARDGQWFSLTPVGYEFERGDWDDWLLVRLDAVLGGLTWSAVAPAFTVSDLMGLADWMEHAADPSHESERFWCLEPCFFAERPGFEAGRPRLLITLSHEYGPPGVPPSPGAEGPQFLITIGLRRLLEFVSELRRELDQFPERR